MTIECPRKVLVVDDEPLIRETLSMLLRDEYEVTAVASGHEAIEASRRETFPVVILDLCMEGLSGIETLQRLREIRELQNIIILTAYESMESAITALNLGAFNYLTKPFKRTHLKEVISRGFDVYERQTLRQRDVQQRLMSVHDSFFSLLCHEFNTPLNIILGFSELLSQTVEDPEHSSWISHIREAGNHLHDILMEIVDYMDASHLAAVGVEKEFTPGTLLQPLVQNFAAKEVTLSLDSNCIGSCTLLGPSSSVLMIARKLSRMASHRSRKVQLAVRAQEDSPESLHLQLVVSGTGIRENSVRRNEIEKLFWPYEFIHSDENARATSLGLELATCRKIAEYAGGSVTCQVNARGELDFVAEIPVRRSA